jgi:hypothetical protein
MFIYLATPYSSHDPEEVISRFRQTEAQVAQYLKAGVTVYSPIIHCHELANRYCLPTDFEFWQVHNENMLAAADALYVLTLTGWRHSKGVAAEMHFARSREIPIMLIHPEELECHPLSV